MRQITPKTVDQLEAFIRQEWDNIPISKLGQLLLSPLMFADCYKKNEGCHTVVNFDMLSIFYCE